MATVIPALPAPILDRGLQQALLAFAQPIGQGLTALGQIGQNRLTQQDLANLMAYQQQGYPNTISGALSPILGFNPAGQIPFPQMQSQLGQQLAMQGLGQQIFGDPFGVQRATAGLRTAQSQQALQPKIPTKSEMQAREIMRLEAIPEEQRTPEQQKRLDALYSSALVNITIGEQEKEIPEIIKSLEKVETIGGGKYEASFSSGKMSIKPKGKLSNEQIQRLGTLKELIATAREAKSLYKGKYVGLVQGEIIGKGKEITGLGLSADEATFRRKISSLIRRAYAESGKQISEKEMRILEGFIPRVHQTDVMFEANLFDFISELTRMIESTTTEAREAGYRVPTQDPLGIRK
jgi:hypothetical protein